MVHQWQDCVLDSSVYLCWFTCFFDVCVSVYYRIRVQMLLYYAINAVVWCGALCAPDWNSFLCFVCLLLCDHTHTQTHTHLFSSSFNFIVCIEGRLGLNPCECLCVLHHWFLCFLVCVCPGVRQAFWVSTATIRTRVNLATAWMEGTALCPCPPVSLYQAAPPAPALLATPDSTAKLPRTPRVTPTTPVPTEESAPCCPSTTTNASVPEDGQVGYCLITSQEFVICFKHPELFFCLIAVFQPSVNLNSS